MLILEEAQCKHKQMRIVQMPRLRIPRLIIQNELLKCRIRRWGSKGRQAESGFKTNSHTSLILIGLSAVS